MGSTSKDCTLCLSYFSSAVCLLAIILLLFYGREPSLPCHNDFALPPLARFCDARHSLSEVIQAQCQAVELVEELAASQGRQLRNWKAVERHSYSVNDLLLNKLARPFIGPFRAEEVLGRVNCMYLIRPVQGGRAQVVHFNSFKPFHQRVDHGLSSSSTSGSHSQSWHPDLSCSTGTDTNCVSHSDSPESLLLRRRWCQFMVCHHRRHHQQHHLLLPHRHRRILLTCRRTSHHLPLRANILLTMKPMRLRLPHLVHCVLSRASNAKDKLRRFWQAAQDPLYLEWYQDILMLATVNPLVLAAVLP